MTSNDQGDRSVGGDEQPVELDTNNQCNTHEQGTGNECSQQENSYEQVISQLHQCLASYSHDWIDITRDNVKTYIPKKDIHEAEISQLRSEISQRQHELGVASRAAQSCRERHAREQEKVKSTEKLITETKRDIPRLSSNTMTLEQARCRLLTSST